MLSYKLKITKILPTDHIIDQITSDQSLVNLLLGLIIYFTGRRAK